MPFEQAVLPPLLFSMVKLFEFAMTKAFAVGVGIFALGLVAFSLGFRAPLGIDGMTLQVEQEQRELAELDNALSLRWAAVLTDFTRNRPVCVVRLEDDGAIVANESGQEVFALPDGEILHVGEMRWISLGAETFIIGSLADEQPVSEMNSGWALHSLGFSPCRCRTVPPR